MDTFIGLDVDAVKQLGTDLKAQASTLDRVSSSVDGLVNHLMQIWQGHDALEFHDWWTKQHRPHLQSASQAISGLGQSAHNNAAEQDQASGGGATSGGAHVTGPVHGGSAHTPPIAPIAPVTSVVPQDTGLPGTHRAWEQVQQDYAANSKWLGSYGPGGNYEYQCTAWANNRWHELGYTGPPIGGDGHEMAGNVGGSVSTVPHPGAMASTGGGYNHVMVAEEISPDGNHIRFSEMNTGTGPGGAALHDGGETWQKGEAQEFKGDSWFTKQPDGTWHRDGSRGGNVPLIFANLPGK
jgi:surface antigen/uncharacterized protein YukE